MRFSSLEISIEVLGSGVYRWWNDSYMKMTHAFLYNERAPWHNEYWIYIFWLCPRIHDQIHSGKMLFEDFAARIVTFTSLNNVLRTCIWSYINEMASSLYLCIDGGIIYEFLYSDERAC